MNALEAALVSKLKGAAGLTALLTTYGGSPAIFNLAAPQDAVRPYVTLHRISGEPEYTLGTATEEIEDTIYQVSIWTVGPSALLAGQIFDQVRAALDEQALAVTGWTHLRTARDRDFTDYDSQVNGVHRAIRYRVLLDKQ